VRRLELCAALLAISASADAVRAAVAGALWLPQLRLRETAQQYALKHSLHERAQAVSSLLAEISQHRLRTGILVAGHIAGLWGRPSRWDPGGSMLRPLV
jgi:signal transduction histidine kinase